MQTLELFIIAVGLSMDAFAVSVCKGLSLRKGKFKTSLVSGLYFGFFQALMPLIGYFLGSAFSKYISAFDHWIAFILLALIGGKMIRESFSAGENKTDSSLRIVPMLMLAVATSIDALAVGVGFAFLNVNIFSAVTIIGITTLVISAAGVGIGGLLGIKFKNRAEFAGGTVLILMGLKILLQHLGLINF